MNDVKAFEDVLNITTTILYQANISRGYYE